MSKTIDERVVSMQFDNKKFEENIERTITSLDNLDTTINQFGDKGKDSFINLADGLSRLEIAAFGFYSKVGEYLEGLAGKAAGAIKDLSFGQISAGFDKYQAEIASAQQIMSNVRGATVEDTYDALAIIQEYADETSYSYSEMVKTLSSMGTKGYDLETAAKAVKGIGNWAGISGSSIEQASQAMGYLTKAIAKGKIQAQDWNSLTAQAGLNNLDFIETLIEMGRQTEEWQAYEAKNGLITTDNFTSSVFGQNGLVTSDVLMNTLKAFGEIDEANPYYDLALAGYQASKETTNFKDAIGAVKDAVSSGWKDTFRYIFGDYKEGREFWTFVQDSLLEIFTIGIDFRNEVLEEWHKLENGGWRDFLEGLQAVWEGVKNLGKPIADAFQSVFNLDVDDSVEKLGGLISSFKKKADGFELFTGARENLPEYLSAVRDLKKQLNGGEITQFEFDEAMEGLEEEHTVITQSQKLYNNLRDTFIGVFDAVDLVKETLKGFGKGLQNTFQFVKPLIGFILELAGGIGGFISKISEAVKNSEVFEKVFGSIGDLLGGTLKKAIEVVAELFGKLFGSVKKDKSFSTLKTVLSKVGDAFQWISDKVLNKIVIPAFDLLGTGLGKIIDFLKPIYEVVSEKVGEALKSMGGWFEDLSEKTKPLRDNFSKLSEKVSEFWTNFKENKLSPLWESVKTFFSNVGDAVSDIKDKIKAAFSKNDDTEKDTEGFASVFDRVLDVFSKIATFITDNLIVAFDWLATKSENLKTQLEPIASVFDTVKEAIKNFFKQLTSDDAEDAVTIWEKIGGVFETVFSTLGGLIKKAVDWIKETFKGLKLEDAISLIVELLKGVLLVNVINFVDSLGGVADSISGFFDSFKKAQDTGHMIRDIGIALLLMAGGIYAISKIPRDQIEQSLMVMIALMTGLYFIASKLQNTTLFKKDGAKNFTGIQNLLSSNNLVKGDVKILNDLSTKYIDIAAAVFILAKALKSISEIPTDHIWESVGILVSMMAALGLVSKFLLNNVKIDKLGIPFIAFAFSIKLLVGVLGDAADIAGKKNIGTACKIVAGAIGALALGIRIAGKGSLGAAAGIVAFGLAVKLITGCLLELSDFYSKGGQISEAAKTLAIVIGALGVAIRLAGKAGLGAAATVLAFAITVTTITNIMKDLMALNGSMDQLVETAISMGIILVALGGAVALSGEGSISGAIGIIAIAAAMNMLIEPMMAMSKLNFGQILEFSIVMLAVAVAARIAGPALTGLIGAIGTFVTSLALFIAVVGLFGDTVSGVGESTTTALDNFLAKAEEYAVRFGQMALTFIAGFIEGIAQGAADLVASIVHLIYDIAQALYENKEQIADAVYFLLMTVLQIVLTVLNNILNGILEFFGMARVETGNIFTDLIGIVLSGAARILMAVVDVLTDIVMAIFEFITLAPLYLIKFFLQIFGINTEAIDNIIQGVKDFFTEAWANIKAALAEIWEKVTGWFKGLWEKIKGIFKGKDKDTGDLAEDAAEGMDRVTNAMGDSIEEGGSEVEQKALGVSEDTVDALDQEGDAEEQAEEKGESILDSFGGSFDLENTDVKSIFDNAEGIGTGVLDGFSLGGTGDVQAESEGGLFKQGFINGLGGDMTGVWNAASQIAQVALQALHTTMDANSPSKKTMELGGFFGMGFVKGIDGTENMVANSAENMGENAIDVLKSSLKDLDFTSDELTNPVIRPVLDLSEIQNGEGRIQDLLNGDYGVGFLGTIRPNGAAAQAANSGDTTINMTINGAEGQDVETLADIVTRRINQSLKSKERVWA